jgi:hypothetical protein
MQHSLPEEASRLLMSLDIYVSVSSRSPLAARRSILFSEGKYPFQFAF